MYQIYNKFLVTGADGFIGKSVCEALTKMNFDIVKLTNTQGGVNSEEYISTLPKVDCVIHLAGKHFVPDSWLHSSSFYEVNIIGTQNVINYCLKHNAKLICASTYVYGQPKFLPISENHPVDCLNPYSLSKYMAEELIVFNQRHNRLRANVLRLFNVYGPYQKPDYLIPKLLYQAKEAPKFIVNTLGPKRDYVFVEDVAQAIVAASISKNHGSILNIGSGESHSVKEIIDLIKDVTGVDKEIQVTGIARVNEVMDVVSDNRLALKELGWKPLYDLRSGIAKIWETQS